MFGKNKTQDPDGEFFTVFDTKSQSYTEPFPAPNSAVLMRDFTTAFRHPDAPQKNRYFQNAEDFQIFKCGKFSLKTGLIESQQLEHVANCHDLKAMALGDARPGH